jgi:serine/threonine protein kinase
MGACLNYVKRWLRVGRIFNINGKRLKELSLIAEGGYGYVLLVEDIDTSKQYALKKLICQTKEQKENYKQEVDIMKRLSGCPHVIGYHGYYEVTRNDFL